MIILQDKRSGVGIVVAEAILPESVEGLKGPARHT